MAAATCTADGLIEAGSCFTQQNFNAHQQKAMLTYLLAGMLRSAGGVDYTTNFPQLAALSSCVAEGLSDDQKKAAVIGILNRGFDTNTLPLDVPFNTLTKDQMAEAIKCVALYSDKQLDGMIVYLLCNIMSLVA